MTALFIVPVYLKDEKLKKTLKYCISVPAVMLLIGTGLLLKEGLQFVLNPDNIVVQLLNKKDQVDNPVKEAGY